MGAWKAAWRIDISTLSELTDAVSLKKDGSRVSLEGVLTGAAFGIVFLYLLDAGQQALAGQRRPTGSVILGDDGGLGPFRTSVGRIPIAPIGEVEVGQTGRSTANPGTDGNIQPPQTPGSGDALAPTRRPIGLAHDPSPGYGGSRGFEALPNAQPSASGNGGSQGFEGLPIINPSASGSGIASTTPTTNKDTSNKPAIPSRTTEEVPADPLEPVELPTMFLVLVRVTSQSNASSVDGKAISQSLINQHSVTDSMIDMRDQTLPGFEMRSELYLPASANSRLSDADLQLISQNVAFVNSTVLGGAATDLLVIGVQDLLSLFVVTPTAGSASVNSLSGGAMSSTIELGDGANVLDVEALQRLSFTAVGLPDRAQLSFSLLTEGLKSSLIKMGAGSDSLLINSGWYGGDLPPDSPLFMKRQELGISLDFNQLSAMSNESGLRNVSLNATAIGMDTTSVDLGGGNNYMAINTRIDQDLSNQLALLGPGSSSQVELIRIGMRDSSIRMGGGDDTLIVNGSILNSTIDLGGGSNRLLLEMTPDDRSTIVNGSGSNEIMVSNLVGSALKAGSGNDTLFLTDGQAYGSFDGGTGNNSLIATSGSGANRDVVTVTGPDQGYFNAFHYSNVGTLDTGGSNDVVIMELGSSITGKLLGGAGLDRLEFHNWTLPVTVDLDQGSSTAIRGGAAGSLQGFEKVIGGNGNDQLISSGAFMGIDGGLGDDVMYLRWSPWLSANEQGIQVNGGAGKDIFVFSGLDQAKPSSWDGQSGLPNLSDFDLSYDNSKGIGLTDRIGVVNTTLAADGTQKPLFSELTPSGLSGVGNVKLLPIAPIEQLLSGMGDNTKQLAISFDPLSNRLPDLVMLGNNGKGTYGTVAHLQINRIESTLI